MSEESDNQQKMQDIPLEEENQSRPNEEHKPVERNLSKTNSLKRFFKLKKTGEAELSLPANDLPNVGSGEVSEGFTADVPGNSESKSRVRALQRRFHLRSGEMGEKNTEENATGSSGTRAGGQQKSTLKSSISNYWNTVFKRNQSQHSVKNAPKEIVTEEIDIDGGNANEESITSEIHTLPISEEEPEEIAKDD